jgi:hypothetical protein
MNELRSLSTMKTESDYTIRTLRELHARMDAAVLAVYGWTDLPTACDFILDCEEDEAEEPTARKPKKPWRYRWPDETRDEVLARLLKLNAARQRRATGGIGCRCRPAAEREKGRQGKTAKRRSAGSGEFGSAAAIGPFHLSRQRKS